MCRKAIFLFDSQSIFDVIANLHTTYPYGGQKGSAAMHCLFYLTTRYLIFISGADALCYMRFSARVS